MTKLLILYAIFCAITFMMLVVLEVSTRSTGEGYVLEKLKLYGMIFISILPVLNVMVFMILIVLHSLRLYDYVTRVRS